MQTSCASISESQMTGYQSGTSQYSVIPPLCVLNLQYDQRRSFETLLVQMLAFLLPLCKTTKLEILSGIAMCVATRKGQLMCGLDGGGLVAC